MLILEIFIFDIKNSTLPGFGKTKELESRRTESDAQALKKQSESLKEADAVRMGLEVELSQLQAKILSGDEARNSSVSNLEAQLNEMKQNGENHRVELRSAREEAREMVNALDIAQGRESILRQEKNDLLSELKMRRKNEEED